MFGRIFLIILSVISLLWIVFIGYDLLDKKNQISPQHIFTEKDGEILIVNHSEEVNLNDLKVKIPSETQDIFVKLLKNVYPNERIYISEKRPLIIIELPGIWNESNVKNYFSTKQINFSFSGEKSLKINGNFIAKFKKNCLLISKTTILSHKEFEWPLWDYKASASIIQLKKPLKSVNVYFKANGTISYETKYGPVIDCEKVDDQDLFAQFLPQKLKNYHFLEKKYAQKCKLISKESSLYEWMEDGMVLFDYRGKKCVLSDYNKSIDPLQMLQSDQEVNQEQMLSNHFTGIELCKNFPQDLDKGFYISKVGDKVLMAETKEVLEQIVADYQLGNTLALDGEKVKQLFDKMPKKVSERISDLTNFYALSSFKYLIIKTTLAKENSILEEEIEQNLSSNESNNSSFSAEQETDYFLGNGEFLFAIGKENEIIALYNKKQVWKLNLEGKFVGKVKLIDLNENGKQQLLISTTEKIYLINAQNGSAVNEFPIDVNTQNPVSFYRWNGKTNFLIANKNNEVLTIDENGRILRKIKLKITGINDEIDVYKNGSVLTAIVSGSEKTVTLDVERNKLLKAQLFLPQNRFQLKNDNGYVYLKYENNILSKYSQKSDKSILSNSSQLKNIKKLSKGKEQFLAFLDKSSLKLVSNQGLIFQTIPLEVLDIEDFDILTLRNGKTYIAVLDGIENNIYIYDTNGKKVVKKEFEGKKYVKLSDNQGSLTITSTLENTLIQHYDVLK